MIGALQPMHLIIVLVIVLLVFGPGKLPELGRAVGDGLRELKRGASADEGVPVKQVTPMVAIGAVCPRCKISLQANANFCGGCGASLEAGPVL
jgi:sec-independent protein translocase protein TatA